MVEVTGEVKEKMIIQLEHIHEILEPLIPQLYTAYKVKMVNKSSSVITNIHLGMIGVEKSVSVDSLAFGAYTEHFKFLLRKPKQGEPIPISYGDYVANYEQPGIEK